jgi:hypothetical protein
LSLAGKVTISDWPLAENLAGAPPAVTELTVASPVSNGTRLNVSADAPALVVLVTVAELDTVSVESAQWMNALAR